MSKIALVGDASGTGTLSIVAPNTSTDRTLTLPDESGTVLTSGGAIDVNASAPADSVVISSTGNVGIGTSSAAKKFVVSDGGVVGMEWSPTDYTGNMRQFAYNRSTNAYVALRTQASQHEFYIDNTESMRIDTSGRLLVNKTSTSETTTGVNLGAGLGGNTFVAGTVGGTGAYWGIMINRQDTDGSLITFRQANTDEGSISVSGTTVSYNGGHLSRWAQTTTAKDESLKKGTVLSNLDEMNVYVDAEGNPVDNEQLNKVKVSDVEGDANVAGVFVNWTYDETHQVDEINMAMTGDMIVRIAQGVTVARGDLLMSAGDGTAMPQGDDIVRSKTIAKVTSTHVTCTYDDGSYCVPCVLMAC
jgi:ethanolamine utilization protein EutQ (cupin superfamily)